MQNIGKNIPIFAVSENLYEKLALYDIDNEEDNYVIHIFYDLNINTNSLTNLFVVPLICIGLCICTVIWWHCITFKIYSQETTSLQKFLTVLPYLKFLSSLMLIQFISVSMDKISSENILTKIYLDTVLVMINSIYRTLFLFYLIIISYVIISYLGLSNI